MKKLLFSALLAAMFCGRALAVTIDFETAPTGPLTNFYAGLGVTFSNTRVTSEFGALAGASGTKYIVSISGDTTPGAADAIVASFSSPQTTVSITGLDVGSAGVRIDAYDAPVGGSLIDFDQVFGVGVGVGNFVQVSAGAPSIWRVEIYQPAADGGDGIVFDDLIFSGGSGGSVPESGTTASLLGVALTGMVLIRRKLR